LWIRIRIYKIYFLTFFSQGSEQKPKKA